MNRQALAKRLGTTVALVGASCTATTSFASIVTLTGVAGVGSNSNIPADHGSVAGEVDLDWTPNGGGGWQTYTAWPNGGDNGDVYQIDGNDVSINFAPLANVELTIQDFDLNVWPGGGDTSVDWSVLAGPGGNILASGSVVVTNGSVLNVAPNFVGSAGQALTLRLLQLNGGPSYLAMDNLTFATNVVPEPTSLTMLGLGLGAAAMRRRKRVLAS